MKNLLAAIAILFCTVSVFAADDTQSTQGSTGTVSSAEQFKRLDVDGSGMIDENEATAAGLTKAQFQALDSNGDGGISLKEFDKALKQ